MKKSFTIVVELIGVKAVGWWASGGIAGVAIPRRPIFLPGSQYAGGGMAAYLKGGERQMRRPQQCGHLALSARPARGGEMAAYKLIRLRP